MIFQLNDALGKKAIEKTSEKQERIWTFNYPNVLIIKNY